MPAYRVQYLDHQPGEYGSNYGDCWRSVTPDRRYTKLETAQRIMREHAEASTAPAFRRGRTRIVEIDEAGEKREIAFANHPINAR